MPDFSDEADGVRAAKAELRARMIAARRARPPADHLPGRDEPGRDEPARDQPSGAGAAAVVQTLVDLVRRLRPAVLAAYAPLGGEPGGPDLPEALARAVAPHNGRVLLPVLRPDLDLDWAAYTGPASLAVAGRGLREPTGPRLGRDEVGTAGLVVVPALAVDGTGRRLGRGGGSYDRALARVRPDAVTVALLFDGEMVEAVPHEHHDCRVRTVITPAGGLQWLDRRPM